MKIVSRMGEEQIYEILKSAIYNHDLIPGMQLVEASLAEAFGVSRTPIRSVLRRLEYESLVKIIPNRGAFVYCPTPEEAEELLMVRRLLEAEAASRAAQHASEEELAKMRELLDLELECYRKKDNSKALEVISAFHMAVVEASHNTYLIRYLKELITLTHVILNFYDTSDVEAPRSPEEHERIFQAIKQRNASLAHELASKHIDFIREEIDFTQPLQHSKSIEQVIERYFKG